MGYRWRDPFPLADTAATVCWYSRSNLAAEVMRVSEVDRRAGLLGDLGMFFHSLLMQKPASGHSRGGLFLSWGHITPGASYQLALFLPCDATITCDRATDDDQYRQGEHWPYQYVGGK